MAQIIDGKKISAEIKEELLSLTQKKLVQTVWKMQSNV